MPTTLSHLRFALRDGTRAAHERIDARAGAFDLAKRADYLSFLLWHAALVPGLESHLEASGIESIVPDWPERSRAGELVGDLAALGGEPPAPVCAPLPETRAGLIGIAYVLEGSRLGGAMLVRDVDPALRGVATRYLDHGAGLRLWPRFVDILGTLKFDGAETDAAVSAANHVFDLFGQALDDHLDRHGAHPHQ